ncbi:hypothetical protein [Martelella alba]|uniref:Uncharacterized protein n=1 Tax=Martelella alba TaxID=2590451 RepID=A0ABY2SKQ5_9HYPH|nr:hypothetical protein [Martelella alba]TKI05986.1 hypothetical protein FCN80_12285 [Martelella alba]
MAENAWAENKGKAINALNAYGSIKDKKVARSDWAGNEMQIGICARRLCGRNRTLAILAAALC